MLYFFFYYRNINLSDDLNKLTDDQSEIVSQSPQKTLK